MAAKARRVGSKSAKGGEGKSRKRSLILSPRNDTLLSTEAARRGCSRSAIIEEALTARFHGVRICWPGEPVEGDEAAA